MLSRVSERKMVSVRAVLFLGWLGLIASLFWDPMTPMMTQPGTTWSPFHIQAASMTMGHETFVVKRGGEPVCEIVPVRTKAFTGRDFVGLLRSLPHPGKKYLDAVEEHVRNQPRTPKAKRPR